MKSICTSTKATFITAGGEKVSYQEIFEAIRKSVEIYGKNAGRPLGAEALEDLFQDRRYGGTERIAGAVLPAGDHRRSFHHGLLYGFVPNGAEGRRLRGR